MLAINDVGTRLLIPSHVYFKMDPIRVSDVHKKFYPPCSCTKYLSANANIDILHVRCKNTHRENR